MTKSEREIEREILIWLNAQERCKAWKNKSTGTYDPVRKAFRRSNDRYSQKGSSDILGIWDGLMLCIEVKSATGRLTPEQSTFLHAMQELGAFCLVARSVSDVSHAFAARLDSLGTSSDSLS